MYESDFPIINENCIGYASISTKDKALVYLANPAYKKAFTVSTGKRVGIYTGRYFKQDSLYFLQIEFEAYLNDGTETHKFGFVQNDFFTAEKVGQNGTANQIINGILSNNKTILENNLLCAALIDKMDVANVDIPDDYRKQLYSLQTELQKRNDHLNDSVFISKKELATPQGFNQYGPTLTNFMNDPGLGIAPVVIYIVVSVVFGMLVSGIIYLLFKKDYTDSKSHLVISQDLTKALATLSPEAKAEVIKDLEGQVDAAYIAGKTEGSGSGILKTVSYVAAGFIGFTLIDKALTKRQTS